MAPKKLSESDKKDILSLYRETDETTSTIAGRYGVSNTTISRILKQSLSDREYDRLIQQKRAGGIARHQAELEDDAEFEEEPFEEDVSPEEATEQVVIPLALEPEEELANVEPLLDTPTPYPRRRRRSSSGAVLNDPSLLQPDLPLLDIPLPTQEENQWFHPVDTTQPGVGYEAVAYDDGSVSGQELLPTEVNTIQEILKEEILDQEEDFEDEEDDLEDELDEDGLDEDGLDEDGLDEDEDDLDNGSGEELPSVASLHLPLGESIKILPLSEAIIPRTFYLVVDRASELITRPLKDFAELGQIPDGEIQEKTLPIFDNHRVAKRFLRRMQRVIKVPDGKMLQKASPYLQAKGITRLLIDGRIYALPSDL